MPVAANCWLSCRGMLESAGVTDIEDRVAEVTVRVVLPWVLPTLAVMVVVPAPTAVARPLLFTVATVVSDEFQSTCEVISWGGPPPRYAPVATNCWVACRGIIGLAGVTVMDSGASGPHANKHAAKEIRNNIAETNLRIFIRTPFDSKIAVRSETAPYINIGIGLVLRTGQD